MCLVVDHLIRQIRGVEQELGAVRISIVSERFARHYDVQRDILQTFDKRIFRDVPQRKSFSFTKRFIAPPDVAAADVRDLVRMEQKGPEVVFLDNIPLEFGRNSHFGLLSFWSLYTGGGRGCLCK